MLRFSFHPRLSERGAFSIKDVFLKGGDKIMSPLLQVYETDTIEKVLSVSRRIRGNFSRVYLFGMGGSILPAKALLNEISDKVTYVENYSSREFENALHDAGEDAHFIFVSKSGRTLEVCMECGAVTSRLMQKTSHPERYVTLLTADPTSPLVKIAPEGAEIVELPSDVSGRFSLFTAGALLPSAVEGEDYLREAVKAGENLIEEYNNGSLIGVVEDFLHHIMEWYREGAPIMVIWLYERHLRPLGMWLQQVWCESLGKKGAYFQPDVIPVYGPESQHTLFQQFVDGEDRRFYVFLNQKPIFPNSVSIPEGTLTALGINKEITTMDVECAQKSGIRDALIKSGRKVLDVKISPAGVEGRAYFMGFTMVAVATAGILQGINPYNQPGVELGKKLALSRMGVA